VASLVQSSRLFTRPPTLNKRCIAPRLIRSSAVVPPVGWRHGAGGPSLHKEGVPETTLGGGSGTRLRRLGDPSAEGGLGFARGPRERKEIPLSSKVRIPQDERAPKKKPGGTLPCLLLMTSRWRAMTAKHTEPRRRETPRCQGRGVPMGSREPPSFLGFIRGV
jgi:hypothetical protein